MLTYNRQRVNSVNGHTGLQMDLLDTSESTAPPGPHQPSSIGPPLPRPLRRQLIWTAFLNHHFHLIFFFLFVFFFFSCSTAPSSAAVAYVMRINTTHNADTPTNTNTTTFDNRCVDLDYTCPHCDRIFTSPIGLDLAVETIERRNRESPRTRPNHPAPEVLSQDVLYVRRNNLRAGEGNANGFADFGTHSRGGPTTAGIAGFPTPQTEILGSGLLGSEEEEEEEEEEAAALSTGNLPAYIC
nr:unnamed protein product [Spirometra erinaceieuropaei]